MGPFIGPGSISLLVLDPMFTDTFDLIQRVQTVNGFGEVVITSTTVANLLAVITPAKPADLRRLPEVERGHRTLTIYTNQHLNTAAVGRQPDLVVWRNDTFIVKEVLPWTAYGPGWTKVLATSIDAVEALT